MNYSQEPNILFQNEHDKSCKGGTFYAELSNTTSKTDRVKYLPLYWGNFLNTLELLEESIK